MNDAALVAGLAASIGAAVAWPVARAVLARPPAHLMRTNVSGASVPAVLGRPVVTGGLAAIAVMPIVSRLGWDAAEPDRVAVAAVVLLVAMAAAGTWDDGRGDERPRGFAGHLAAAGGGRLTGGIVKILAAGAAGLAAGILLHPRDLPMIVLTVAAVGLGANLVNLFDRAPGRAGKLTLLLGIPLAFLGDPGWGIAAAGTLAALTAVLPADLGERGMLGDAGANPLGALLGLGLAGSLDAAPLTGAVVALLALNLASERWSFSQVIDRTPVLRAIDRLGRK